MSRTLGGPSALKLGLFAANCSSGTAATTVPERWSGSWEDNLRLVRLADGAGFDFMLPIARWKGYGGATDFEGSSFETITWACGLLGESERITVFGTVHAPLVHPVFAAKQMVTADHLGRGRFGLNLVCGWNQDEFDMFGVERREHEQLYGQGAEWIEIVKRLWTESAAFDFDGTYFTLRGVRANPKPFGSTRPIVMNAGSSPVGKAFAVRHCDFLFSGFPTIETGADAVRETQARAAEAGRAVSVFTSCHVVCRPTQSEADAYYAYFADECADWDAVENLVSYNANPKRRELYDRYRRRFAAGYGGYPVIGDPEAVARELVALHGIGIAGICLSFVNYLDELPFFCAEVLPRLERLGLRARS